MDRRHWTPWIVALCVLTVGKLAAAEPATRPTTQPGTLHAVLVEAQQVLESLDDAERRAVFGNPAGGDADEPIKQLTPLLDQLGEVDAELMTLPTYRPGIDDFPEYMVGLRGLLGAAVGGLTPARADDEASLNAAARRAVDLARALRPISEMNGTGFWFEASTADRVLLGWLGSRALSIDNETLAAMAALPPLRSFAESTGQEGNDLIDVLRESKLLPSWVEEAAERNVEGDADEAVAAWQEEWADDDRKDLLIAEYKLYFDVEVELAEVKDDPEQLEQFLDQWEAGHERESLWLSRYTLMSPRSGYVAELTQEAMRDLFAVLVAGKEANDIPAAVRAADELVGGREVRILRQGRQVLLATQVPLAEEPVMLAIGQ